MALKVLERTRGNNTKLTILYDDEYLCDDVIKKSMVLKHTNKDIKWTVHTHDSIWYRQEIINETEKGNIKINSNEKINIYHNPDTDEYYVRGTTGYVIFNSERNKIINTTAVLNTRNCVVLDSLILKLGQKG